MGEKMRFRKLLFASVFVIASCGTKTEYVDTPVPVYKVEVTASQPGGDPRCSCSQSRALFASNNDVSSARYARIRTDVADANAPHLIIDMFKRELLVPTKGSEFLGCSIETVAGGPACGRLNAFTVENEVVIRKNVHPQLKTLGAIYTPDIATCSAVCASGSPECLALGAEMLPLVTPITTLMAAADAGPGVIKRDDLLKAFGASPSDDICNRSDVIVSKDELRNTSSLPADEKFCNITVGDKPNFMLPVTVAASIPKDLVASRPDSSAMKAFGAAEVTRYLAFENRAEAPAFGFRTSTSGSGLDDDLTDRYGGSVLSAAQVDEDIIIATSNGCISFPAPNN